MSKVQLDKFISLVKSDPSIWNQASGNEQDAQKFVENVVQYAKGRGYDFSEAEAKAWMIEYREQAAGGELKDAQLDAVAGGTGGGGGAGTLLFPTAPSFDFSLKQGDHKIDLKIDDKTMKW